MPVWPPNPGLTTNERWSDRTLEKPTENLKPIELLPGDSKKYETKCSRISSLVYTLYFLAQLQKLKFTMASQTATHLPVWPPEQRWSDRRTKADLTVWDRSRKATQGMAGLTATMAGLTARGLTELEQRWKWVILQTLNAIANCLIILRSCVYPHDIHNLPLDEYIGNFSENIS